MVEKVLSQVKFEIEQIDHLLKSYADLLERIQKREPDLIEVTAVASVLHSFYNGLENIFPLPKELTQTFPRVLTGTAIY